MSLINDALKKTQQARAAVQNEGPLTNAPYTQEAAPSSNGGSPWPWIFGIVALLVIAVPVSIWLLTSKDEAPEQLETPLSELVANSTPPIAQPQAEPEATPQETAKEDKSTETPPPAEESQTKAPQRPTRISANPEIVELLKTINVTGLLLSQNPDESKILLDGEVYTVNGVINSQLGCRIAEIKQNAVVFIDESGVKYTKRF